MEYNNGMESPVKYLLSFAEGLVGHRRCCGAVAIPIISVLMSLILLAFSVIRDGFCQLAWSGTLLDPVL